MLEKLSRLLEGKYEDDDDEVVFAPSHWQGFS